MFTCGVIITTTQLPNFLIIADRNSTPTKDCPSFPLPPSPATSIPLPVAVRALGASYKWNRVIVALS